MGRAGPHLRSEDLGDGYQHRCVPPIDSKSALLSKSALQLNRKSQGGCYRPKMAAFFGVKESHFSGRSSSAKIAETGQTGTQAPQSIHSTGSMYNISSFSKRGSSFFG